MQKIVLLFFFISTGAAASAQKIDSIFLNLYTDSLKKGTYNYINVDGRMSNGKYLPLDTTHLIFTSNQGKFFGNSLWIDENFDAPKVQIRIYLKSDSTLQKAFDMYIKTMEDPDNLKTNEQILEEYKRRNRKPKRRGS